MYRPALVELKAVRHDGGMTFLRWTAALLVSATGCLGGGDDPQYELLEPRPGILGIGAVQQLEATRKPGAPPPTVHGHFALSEYAIERMQSFAARITVSGARRLPGEGFRADWLGESSASPIVGHFEGEPSSVWAADLVPGGCVEPPCVLSFELGPAGGWNTALELETHALAYELRAWLEVRGQYRSEVEELASALVISLEEAP